MTPAAAAAIARTPPPRERLHTVAQLPAAQQLAVGGSSQGCQNMFDCLHTPGHCCSLPGCTCCLPTRQPLPLPPTAACLRRRSSRLPRRARLPMAAAPAAAPAAAARMQWPAAQCPWTPQGTAAAESAPRLAAAAASPQTAATVRWWKGSSASAAAAVWLHVLGAARATAAAVHAARAARVCMRRRWWWCASRGALRVCVQAMHVAAAAALRPAPALVRCAAADLLPPCRPAAAAIADVLNLRTAAGLLAAVSCSVSQAGPTFAAAPSPAMCRQRQRDVVRREQPGAAAAGAPPPSALAPPQPPPPLVPAGAN